MTKNITKLQNFLLNYNGKFSWGDQDCLLFVSQAVDSQLGTDYYKQHKGKYNTAFGAYKYLHTLGFKNPIELLDSIFNRIEVHETLNGDIAVFPQDEEHIAGIVFFERIFAISQQGIVNVSKNKANTFWRVK